MNLNNSLSLTSAVRLAEAIENHINNVSPMHVGTLTFKPNAADEAVLKEVAQKLRDCDVEFINRNNEWLVITTYRTIEALEAELLTPGFKILNDINVVKIHKESLRIGTRLDQASGKNLKDLYEAAKAYA